MKRLNNKVFTLSGASHIDTLPKLRKDGFTKPSRATSASESPTIMSVMDIPTNWRRWRLLRGAVKQKSAFTLAEVLITLGIIGIVSALTLPVLIQNINGHKYRNQFKKSFSTLSQAVRMAQEQYELTFAMLDQTCDDTGTDANPRSNRSMCALLNGTLKGASYVGQASEIYGNKDIKIGDYPISDYLVYRLSDGSLVGFYKDLKTCTVPTGTQLTESVLTGTGALKNCLGFIDVNGDKNPNDLVQGTSADSISWLFGLPVAYGYGYGYGYDDSPCGESICYNSKGEYCYGDCPDDYVYTWSEFDSQAKYNSQGQRGIGDEYKYSYKPYRYGADGSFCGPTYCVDAEGNHYEVLDGHWEHDAGYTPVFRSIEANPCQQDDHCLSISQNASSETTDKCSLSSFDPSAVCRVENKSGQISDIFPIVFHDGVVEPASGPARAVLHQAK